MNSQPTILQRIFAKKKIRVEEAKSSVDPVAFASEALEFRKSSSKNKFRRSFDDTSGVKIIAEIKRASPSKGDINQSVDVADMARTYENSGAAAISVLTEEDFFGGSVEDLRIARKSSELPILRKDFVFDEYQVYESALIGADAILLIVAMLGDELLEKLYSLAEVLALDVLVETRNLDEMERALGLGADIIGVNNRDLHTFEVSLDASRELIKLVPQDSILIAESGLKTKEDLVDLQNLGFSGFLIGESLMTADNAGEKLRSLQ